MKTIVHITESLGGGVCSLLSSICKLQFLSYRVILIYSIRGSSPSSNEMSRLFPAPIELISLKMLTNISFREDVLSLINIFFVLKKINPDIIHLHSSKAGALGRVAAKMAGMGDKVFYSPHGLSFLRLDISCSKKFLYKSLEWFASKISGVIIASSKSEELILQEKLNLRNLKCIPNGVDFSAIKKSKGFGKNQIRIITTGRITYAKAPWKFKEIALSVKNKKAHFFWAGDGELRNSLLRLPLV